MNTTWVAIVLTHAWICLVYAIWTVRRQDKTIQALRQQLAQEMAPSPEPQPQPEQRPPKLGILVPPPIPKDWRNHKPPRRRQG